MDKREGRAGVIEIDPLLKAIGREEISPELLQKLRKPLGAVKAVRPIPSAKWFTFQFSAVFVLLAIGLAAWMGISGFRSLHFGQSAGIAIIVGMGVVLLSLALAWQMHPVSSQRLPGKAAGISFALGFVAGAALLYPARGLDHFVAEGWPCAAIGVAIALPAALLFGLMARRGVPLSPGPFGSILGAMAALLGVTVLQFHCLHQHAAHVAVWHGGILVGAAVLGYLTAKALTRFRTLDVGRN